MEGEWYFKVEASTADVTHYTIGMQELDRLIDYIIVESKDAHLSR